MAVTAPRSRPHWLILLRPRWLAWHLFAVVAILGMLWLGDWQLHRAESGNELSWAYTFEWPLFAIMGGYFWIRTLRDELRAQSSAGPASEPPRNPLGSTTGPEPAESTAAADAYVERLKAEVRSHGKWHGWR